jgi:hypothetical protein
VAEVTTPGRIANLHAHGRNSHIQSDRESLFGAQSVTISTATSGATITYTTDGSTPVPGSHGTVYAFPVLVSASLTLKAVGSPSGFNNSAAGSAGYTINPPLIAPANPAVTMQ